MIGSVNNETWETIYGRSGESFKSKNKLIYLKPSVVNKYYDKSNDNAKSLSGRTDILALDESTEVLDTA